MRWEEPSTDWSSRQPDLSRSAPAQATAEKGRRFWGHQVGQLAALVRAIKQDQLAGQLYREFNQRIYRR